MNTVEDDLKDVSHQVAAIFNYDRFDISPELVDTCAQALKRLTDQYFTVVTGYTASTFMRAKLNDTLKIHSIDLGVYQSLSDAKQHLIG